jgi:hypothetical protein
MIFFNGVATSSDHPCHLMELQKFAAPAVDIRAMNGNDGIVVVAPLLDDYLRYLERCRRFPVGQLIVQWPNGFFCTSGIVRIRAPFLDRHRDAWTCLCQIFRRHSISGITRIVFMNSLKRELTLIKKNPLLSTRERAVHGISHPVWFQRAAFHRLQNHRRFRGIVPETRSHFLQSAKTAISSPMLS